MMSPSSWRAEYWKVRFRRWPAPSPLTDGYTLLVPVPGDIPVFLNLALAVCGLQRAASRAATLVIPDRWTPAIAASVERARPTWQGELALVTFPLLERIVLPRLGDGGRNHAAQLIIGASRARTTHVILHDADLFLLREGAHEDQYRYAAEHDLAVLGVDPAWDHWYAEHGRTLAATWEMTARVDWLRAFPPYRHMGHDDELWGERHTFDTTFWPQCHTDPARIEVRSASEGIVHFNYVIGTYRRFQRRPPGAPFPDPRFLLLLIRVLVDLFDEGRVIYRLPSLGELSDALTRHDGEVRYPGREGSQNYAAFRRKMQAILDGPWTSPTRRAAAITRLAPFDGFYGWVPSVAEAPER